MKTAATNKKVREIITLIRDKKLIPKPDFQRRLVWSTDDKNNFIDTILSGYPFPEIFIADGNVDLATGDGLQVLVDGQQRVTTLFEYFTNSSTLKLKSVPPYSSLSEQAQRDFLNYDVAVRDLGSVSLEQIKEVFRRINVTSYPLNPMELNNAIYAGALKNFAEDISNLDFFENHRIFNANDMRRMGDIRYILTLICTMLTGYFNRDDELETLLNKFNDTFPFKNEVDSRIKSVLSYIDDMSLGKDCRIWKKADLFTAIIEIDLIEESLLPKANIAREKLSKFYNEVQLASLGESLGLANDYYIDAVQGTNNKSNRVNRGKIFRQALLES